MKRTRSVTFDSQVSCSIPPTSSKRALKTLLKKDLQGLIIDVRYNPGGILDQAVKICDLFLEKGVIVSTAGRAVKSQRYEASSSNPLPKFPIVVMVNRFSASASEIVAACLQDHKRAIVFANAHSVKAVCRM